MEILIYMMYSSLANKRVAWNIPKCMVLLHPSCLLELGNFPTKLIFLRLISEKFRRSWPHYILHAYQFSEIFQPALLLHPAHLFNTVE